MRPRIHFSPLERALYHTQARELEAEILSYWDPVKGVFVPTKNQVEGLDYKSADIDSQVVLAFLHGGLDNGFLLWDDPRVISTVNKTIETFKNLYTINSDPSIPGVLIGRYLEDRYGGDNLNEGNGWVLATLAIAEVYNKMAMTAIKQNQATDAATDAATKFSARMTKLRGTRARTRK